MKRQWWLMLVSMIFVYALHQSTNRLIDEDSPYLQQHANNPVDWYPWGKEALQKAQKEKKLIFLSIGYSTCHWCHVMEEESFSDEEVAKLLNDNFISIKVDREEYPQLDKKYQRFYRAVHGERGGWPLSVFLSPEGEVIELRTYIPKEEGYGSEGLMHLLPDLIALGKDPLALQKRINAYRLKALISQKIERHHEVGEKRSFKEKVMAQIAGVYDSKNGGFAKRPKFPENSKLMLLLGIYRLYGDQEAFSMADTTLRKMAKGGLYDQIGGGFFRYVTDASWRIPHFEKMLYTNAQLIELYTDAYMLSKESLYRRVVEETIAAMEAHFLSEGLFLSASDADSDGEEGGYYLYAYDVIKTALLKKGWDPKVLESALAYLGIEEDGNIDSEFSLAHITSKQPPPGVERLKKYLKTLRTTRTFPFVDTKINTAWNAMMIKALFKASKIDRQYQVLAQRYMERLWKRMRREGRLYHQSVPGKIPVQEALLEDYAYLIDALIAGYERTYDPRYLQRAKMLAKEAILKFKKKQKWYLSDDGIGAVADHDDRYYTSALSIMWDALLSMASLTEDLKLYRQIAQEVTLKEAVLRNDPLSSPKLAEIYLRLKAGDIIIHASKEKLLSAQTEMDKIRYPFVLSKVQASDAYLACRISSCFAKEKEIGSLIKKIEKSSIPIEQKTEKGALIWQKR